MADSYIIALDFGTAYSGYAFSMTSSEEEIDPRLKFWGEKVGLEAPKAPNCILFDENEEFISFGFEAQETYIRKQGEEATKKLFFNCFKMELYHKEITEDLTIKAANGKSMKALKVFSGALRFLKDDALKTINTNTEGRTFEASDFTWVLTVPAIWDPSAKQFMRKAATEAGIVTKRNEDKLVIALESEAASIWCKKLPADGFIAEKQRGDRIEAAPGTQYMVVDCGGGTIDITVHEVLDGGTLKELHKASGNDQGGQTVDNNFKQLLREIFCDGVWDEYEKNHPAEVQKIMYDFTMFKRSDDDVEIVCTMNLGKIAQKKKDIERIFESVQGVSWNEGSFKITKQKLRSFFDESLEKIAASVRGILQKDFSIEYILLVGGYAESQILRRYISDEFKDDCKVLCPFRPQEAILKGAVHFGRNQAVVASRKSAFTYGLAVIKRFDEACHSADKKVTNKDGDWCDDIFLRLVVMDDDVGWDESKEYILHPGGSDNRKASFQFFQTEKKNPKYVDETGIRKIGTFVIKTPNTAHGLDRKFKLKIKFGSTEMTATATDVDSGSTETIKLDFMTRS